MIQFYGIVILFLIQIDCDFLNQPDIFLKDISKTYPIVTKDSFNFSHVSEHLLTPLNHFLIVLREFLGFFNFLLKLFAHCFKSFLIGAYFIILQIVLYNWINVSGKYFPYFVFFAVDLVLNVTNGFLVVSSCLLLLQKLFYMGDNLWNFFAGSLLAWGWKWHEKYLIMLNGLDFSSAELIEIQIWMFWFNW